MVFIVKLLSYKYTANIRLTGEGERGARGDITNWPIKPATPLGFGKMSESLTLKVSNGALSDDYGLVV